MYSPRLVKEVFGKQLVDDGRLDNVSLYAAGPTADFELDAQEWQDDEYDQQGNLLDPIKVKEGKREDIDWVLKQKLIDYVPQSECAERQDRLSSLKWVLKNKGRKGQSTTGCERDQESQNLKTRSSKRVICFSAMPPVEFESVGQSRDDKTSWPTWTKFGACNVRHVKSTHYTVCVNAMFTWSHPQNYIVLDS